MSQGNRQSLLSNMKMGWGGEVDAFSLYLDPHIFTSKALLLTLKYVFYHWTQFNVVWYKIILLEVQENYKNYARLNTDIVSYWCHHTNADEKIIVVLFFILLEGVAFSFSSRSVNRESCGQEWLGTALGCIWNPAKYPVIWHAMILLLFMLWF